MCVLKPGGNEAQEHLRPEALLADERGENSKLGCCGATYITRKRGPGDISQRSDCEYTIYSCSFSEEGNEYKALSGGPAQAEKIN